eukprot:RCo013318
MCTVSLSSFPCSLPMADFDELGESETGDSQLLQLEANIQRKEETIADTRRRCDALGAVKLVLRSKLSELHSQLEILQPTIEMIIPVIQEASKVGAVLTKQKLGEVHRLQHPPRVVQRAVGVLYTVLECRELSSSANPKDAGPEPLLAEASWPELQRFLGHCQLFQQIHHFSARHLAACPDVLQFLCTAYLGLRYGPCPDHPTRPPTFEELSEAMRRCQTLTQNFGTRSRRAMSLPGVPQLPLPSIILSGPCGSPEDRRHSDPSHLKPIASQQPSPTLRAAT